MESERVEYDLDATSLVMDVGAYRGDFSAAILTRFPGIRIMAFEPMTIYVDSLTKRLRMLSDAAEVLAFGLLDRDLLTDLPLDGDRTSLHHREAIKAEESGGPPTPARFRDAAAFMREREIHNVDLCKINIEGAEFDLLAHLHKAGMLTRFRHLQVQFHDFMPMAQQRYDRIKHALEQSHRLRWRRPWIWESWERR